MDLVYIPAHQSTCEPYWMALLDEGELSPQPVPGPWEWFEDTAISSDIWKEAQRLQEQHVIVTLKIEAYNRGGLIAYWNGVECFIPASHLVAYPFPADPTAREQCFDGYIGQDMRLCIIEVEPGRNRVLLSERQVETCEKTQRHWPEWLHDNAICTGEITSVRPFGVFVDIGPLEGMVHISEISWGRVRHPQDFVQTGQTVQVMILNVDQEHQRVGLSLKRLQPNPWDKVTEKIRIGDLLDGTIASVERFGIFIELLSGLEGLLHISEINQNHHDTAIPLHQQYRVGDRIRVRILNIVPREHRIALGLPA
ncbi:MAG: S1 RNA-binding domain-containing protein [Anaerolineae bacterium]|nr:S1 RNA-binding domain-containing protein [Anaerolineae bacterium]